MRLKSGFLAILGVSAFAVANPVLDALGHGATFFVTHGAEPLDIITFAVAIYLLPAVLLITLAACLQTLSVVGTSVFISAIVGVFAALWCMSLVSALPAIFSIAAALLVGSSIGVCYFMLARFRELTQLLGILSPAVVVFFLLFTPVKSVIFSVGDVEGSPTAGSTTPLVMLLFDELSLAAITTPDGEIDAGRLPNFSRLEKISTWYHDTTTVSTQTGRAVPALLSGMRTHEDTQPVYSEFPRNLFSLLAPSHTIYASETYTRLCPTRVCSSNGQAARVEFSPVAMYQDASIVWLHSVLPKDLAGQYLPSISNRWSDFTLEDVDYSKESSAAPWLALVSDAMKSQSLRFSEFLAAVRDSDGPTVTYLHVILPHVPWTYLPDGTAYNGNFAAGQSPLAYDWVSNQYLVDKGVLRYSLQVEYVDVLLGQALDALEESGQLDRAMLVVVSDHGVGFTPGRDRRMPSPATLADVVRVPLFIKYPGQRSGVRDNRKIETIDILPTITDVLRLSPSPQMDGQSLIADDWHQVQRQVLEAADDLSEFEQDMNMRAASKRIYRVIKPGHSALDAIGLGAGKQYIGTPAPVPVARETRFDLRLRNSKWYKQVDIDGGFLPALMRGTMNGASLGTPIMVALNGTVAGSGQTYNESGDVSIMLDPRRFRNGENEVRVYSVGGPEILEVTVAMDFDGWSLQRINGDIVVTDDQRITYKKDDTLNGGATSFLHRDGAETLSGYACDETSRLAPRALLLVDGNAVITSSFTLELKPMFSTMKGIADLKCWFTVDVNQDLNRPGASPSILALFDGGRLLEIELP